MALPSPHFQQKAVQKFPVQKVQQKKENQQNDQPRQAIQQQNNFSSYCKYCQVGFINDTELFHHRRSHTKCPYDSCQFNANEVTVANHVQRVHLKQNSLVKIEDLTTPEQIEKWREERRKRYPTTQNVILRQQIQEDKIKRGERLNDSKKRFGDHQQRDFVKNMGKKNNRNNHRDNKSSQNQNRNRKFQPRQPQTDPTDISEIKSVENEQIQKLTAEKPIEKPCPIKAVATKPVEIQESDSSDEETTRKVLKFRGTSSMKNYHTVESNVKEKPALTLLGMYGSDSEDENCAEHENNLENKAAEQVLQTESFESNGHMEINSQTEEIESECSITPQVSAENEENPQEPEENQPSDGEDDGPEELPIVKQTETEDAQKNPAQRHRKRKGKTDKLPVQKKVRRSGLDYSKLKNKSVNPFLEKLLERDIVHERNVLLQCVNFVVNNNFFGIGQSDEKKEDKN